MDDDSALLQKIQELLAKDSSLGYRALHTQVKTESGFKNTSLKRVQRAMQHVKELSQETLTPTLASPPRAPTSAPPPDPRSRETRDAGANDSESVVIGTADSKAPACSSKSTVLDPAVRLDGVTYPRSGEDLAESFLRWTHTFAEESSQPESGRSEMTFQIGLDHCFQFAQVLQGGTALAPVRADDVLNRGEQRPTYTADLTPTTAWQDAEPAERLKETWSWVRRCVLEGAAAPTNHSFLTSYQQCDGHGTSGQSCICSIATLVRISPEDWRFVLCDVDPVATTASVTVYGALEHGWIKAALKDFCTEARAEILENRVAAQGTNAEGNLEAHDIVHARFVDLLSTSEPDGMWQEHWELDKDLACDEDGQLSNEQVLLAMLDANMRGDGLLEKKLGWFKDWHLEDQATKKKLLGKSDEILSSLQEAAENVQDVSEVCNATEETIETEQVDDKILHTPQKKGTSAKERLHEVLHSILDKDVETGAITYSVSTSGSPPDQTYVGTVHIPSSLVDSKGSIEFTGDVRRKDYETAKSARRAAEQMAASNASDVLLNMFKRFSDKTECLDLDKIGNAGFAEKNSAGELRDGAIDGIACDSDRPSKTCERTEAEQATVRGVDDLSAKDVQNTEVDRKQTHAILVQTDTDEQVLEEAQRALLESIRRQEELITRRRESEVQFEEQAKALLAERDTAFATLFATIVEDTTTSTSLASSDERRRCRKTGKGNGASAAASQSSARAAAAAAALRKRQREALEQEASLLEARAQELQEAQQVLEERRKRLDERRRDLDKDGS
eukprot:TRINITY_DN22552_c0_g1_i1.p1 TRINITY_DN22552_c0_g1~~TRINITY_DN22552_c0_g1_i1.p1  ORF type:complete len:790 (-),score=132.95 TRINITY_DN22552_c0_g1_i1:17-2386(-)